MSDEEMIAALQKKVDLLKKERDYYRRFLADMQLSRDSQTRMEVSRAIREGDKIRMGRA